MAKKQFKTESKKLLDMMVNSIYTHKEIFLRELISNASDAIDKQYVKALTDDSLRGTEWEIRISADKDSRILSVSDNGCGMTKAEMESNLGTIAKSGSFDFKHDPNNKNESIDVIGQFGVGFYSAFMVADNIKVVSRVSGSEEAWQWESSGADGYTMTEAQKNGCGTVVTLHIKEDAEDFRYSQFLEEWELKSLVKKYSDYIRYPIKMFQSREQLKEGSEDEYVTVVEDAVLNSMTPIWKKREADVTPEEYAGFYKDKFFDYEDPVKVIRQATEGMVSYEALMFIPGRAPYDYYTKEYEKGLQLYSSGVMIMDKCPDLLPDYFSFVKGVVDSPDLSLNISREMLQHDRQLKVIARNLESKISAKLAEMRDKDRENYEKFFKAFGTQLKFGAYSDYGMHKDVLADLLMFPSSYDAAAAKAAEEAAKAAESSEAENAAAEAPAEQENAQAEEKKFDYVPQLVTLKEYVSRMKEGQDKIYYAAGDSLAQINMMPQVEAAKAKGFEVLCMIENVDEFALQIMAEYEGKTFANVCSEAFDISTEEEKEAIKKENEEQASLLNFVKECLSGVDGVRFTNALKDHAACISNEGAISANMEKTLNRMPGSDDSVRANLILEINSVHPVAEKMKKLYAEAIGGLSEAGTSGEKSDAGSADSGENDAAIKAGAQLADLCWILYYNARLASGLEIEDPAEFSRLVGDLLAK